MTHPTDAMRLATRFHETYERLAPSFGYETREDTKAFDPETPNGRLMIAVCAELAAAPASPLPEGGGQCSGISGELSGWQDLNSAPRDGHEFQAWWKGTWQPRARFDPEYGSFQLWGRTDFDTEGWEVFEIDGFWQPQPAAPTGAK